jgi:CrcB protein
VIVRLARAKENLMPWSGLVAVGGGATLGAWMRWGLGAALNPIFPTLPLGTLAANLVGGLLMGFAIELLARHAVLAPEVRLLVATGFLGGLTTFSAFSAEVVTLLMRREYLWSVLAVAAHVAGSLAMTMVGLLAVRALYTWAAP